MNLKIKLIFAIAIVALLAVGVISYRAKVLADRSEQWVRHTHEVIEKLQDLQLAVETIESNSSQFALTGDELALAYCRTGMVGAKRDMASLSALTADNASQRRRIPEMQRLTDRRLQFAETVIDLRREKGSEAAAEALRSAQHRRIAEDFTAAVRDAKAEEIRLLALRNADALRRSQQTGAGLLAETALALILLLPAGWSVQHDNRRRILAEDRLRYEEATAALLDLTHDAIFVRNLKNEIVYWNKSAEALYGWTRQEAAGRTTHELLQTVFPAPLAEIEAKALREKYWEGELIHRRRDGATRVVSSRWAVPMDGSGNPIGTLESNRDISERKQAEEHLVNTVLELRRSNEQLQQFAWVASHDLQEPLRMVASYTQLLAKRYRGQLDADADEFIAYAVDGCHRMQRLIRDFLTYSRAGSDGEIFHEVAAETSLAEALRNLRTAIEESGAVVTHDALPMIRTDELQLTLVFQNLVSNAIKYRGVEPPRIHISATRLNGKEWTFSVKDNGMGIEPRYFEKIFILFQRLHKQSEFNGTGIGLAICKKVIERLGGKIWVESQPQVGSTFFFSLPGSDLQERHPAAGQSIDSRILT